MTDLTPGPITRTTKVLRLAAAGVGTLLVGLVAAVSWVLARARYTNDYCTSRAPRPEPPMPEATGGRPAYMDGPWTVVCEYDGRPTVEVIEPLPFLGAVFLASVVVGIGVVAFRWALRSAPRRRPDSRARPVPSRPHQFGARLLGRPLRDSPSSQTAKSHPGRPACEAARRDGRGSARQRKAR